MVLVLKRFLWKPVLADHMGNLGFDDGCVQTNASKFPQLGARHPRLTITCLAFF
jgi:hypothetical protein